ncbi:hypothetical protein [Streptomyces prasinus]|uniref:hypothetical protein n=1 Tax=Streptomyces prasinus TaxID=67345 RepID=UPI00333338DA
MECYFHTNGELVYVRFDGRLGPQVSCEGIRLIGRIPSQLAQEMEAHAIKHDTGLQFSPSGGISCYGFQLEIGAQRADDRIIYSTLLFVAGDDQSITRDSAPDAVWHRR